MAAFLTLALCIRGSLASGKAPRTLLIGTTGGTGARAVRGLLDAGLPPSVLTAVSRSPDSSASCKSLTQLGINVAQADLDDQASLNELISRGWDAVYVHGLAGDTKQIDTREVHRGEALAASFTNAVRNGAQAPVVMYNSAAGPEDTGIPRIRQKHRVEAALADSPGVRAFVALRAHLFMEELWKEYTRPGIVGGKRVYAFCVPSDKQLCLTSVYDMGRVAACCALDAPAFASGQATVLDVVSCVRTPAQMAEDFSNAQGGPPVRHKQAWALYLASKVLLPELHDIIRFYRQTNFSTSFGAPEALTARFAKLDSLKSMESFSQFLQNTRWAEVERTFATLGSDVGMLAGVSEPLATTASE
eukprot:CAMPEP_0185157124 /NCGR_PEP_ID=MMETSP1139-20130426/1564_1 /TAXON_ID=298111 /ORGANISM="Pavlova sp., Strain CCMP459" /LENGTH=359 /DNA_ID=CAMNT_0027722181 /DNA_START=97 /DNA_END=1176 /DNA_ORIENTATION=-